jgi:hypothetical protein
MGLMEVPQDRERASASSWQTAIKELRASVTDARILRASSMGLGDVSMLSTTSTGNASFGLSDSGAHNAHTHNQRNRATGHAGESGCEDKQQRRLPLLTNIVGSMVPFAYTTSKGEFVLLQDGHVVYCVPASTASGHQDHVYRLRVKKEQPLRVYIDKADQHILDAIESLQQRDLDRPSEANTKMPSTRSGASAPSSSSSSIRSSSTSATSYEEFASFYRVDGDDDEVDKGDTRTDQHRGARAYVDAEMESVNSRQPRDQFHGHAQSAIRSSLSIFPGSSPALHDGSGSGSGSGNGRGRGSDPHSLHIQPGVASGAEILVSRERPDCRFYAVQDLPPPIKGAV